VAVSAVQEAVSQPEGVPSPKLDVDAAIDEFHPDVVLMHWATHAEGELGRMERHGQPFACRVHSFDVDRERVQRMLDHPLCVAVFAHPHHLAELPPGVQSLIPTVSPRTLIPESPAERTLVLSVSAGLPKKDFPLLVDAMAGLPEYERMIILARSNGMEEVPPSVERLAEEADPSISVCVNVPRRDALEAMAGASVLLYTLEPRSTMGYPMSIIEAVLCGTIPITPDRPESRAVVGPGVRTYRDVSDIQRHVREVAAGGPAVQNERLQLVRLAQRHRDPAELVRLHDALRDQLTAWRASRV
jgi:glycosyltransferase involved in cell wall biosynthesis